MEMNTPDIYRRLPRRLMGVSASAKASMSAFLDSLGSRRVDAVSAGSYSGFVDAQVSRSANHRSIPKQAKLLSWINFQRISLCAARIIISPIHKRCYVHFMQYAHNRNARFLATFTKINTQITRNGRQESGCGRLVFNTYVNAFSFVAEQLTFKELNRRH
jgi:hypothetical protein